MTKFLTFIALLGGGVLSIAQTTLKPSVFIDTKSDDFKKGIVEIKEYIQTMKYINNWNAISNLVTQLLSTLI